MHNSIIKMQDEDVRYSSVKVVDTDHKLIDHDTYIVPTSVMMRKYTDY